MSPTPRIRKGDLGNCYFLTMTTIEWIDIFTKSKYFNLLRDSLLYCIKHKGLVLYEYVFMTNHIHIIAKAEGKNSLDSIIRDFKSFTTHEIKKLLKDDNRKFILRFIKDSIKKKKGSKFQIWQRENYPEEIYSDEFCEQKIQYIWHNPVKKEYVSNPEDWLYSSARQKILELEQDCLEVVLPCSEWEI